MFGIEGGNKYLEYFLKSKSDKKADFKNLCEVISDAFDDISCSLLPHPGNKTLTSVIEPWYGNAGLIFKTQKIQNISLSCFT